MRKIFLSRQVPVRTKSVISFATGNIATPA